MKDDGQIMPHTLSNEGMVMDCTLPENKIHCPLCEGTNIEALGGVRASQTAVERRMCLGCNERFLIEAEMGNPLWPPTDDVISLEASASSSHP